MYHPTTFDDLHDIVDTERDAFVAAAVIPHLPDGDALAHIRDAGDYRTKPEVIDEFKKRVPTIGNADNLRRVSFDPDRVDLDDIDDIVKLHPEPHGIKPYYIRVGDVDLMCPTKSTYDFDNTDQTTLHDHGFGPMLKSVHIGMNADPDAYPRQPLFPV